jgi:hypothetical protein
MVAPRLCRSHSDCELAYTQDAGNMLAKSDKKPEMTRVGPLMHSSYIIRGGGGVRESSSVFSLAAKSDGVHAVPAGEPSADPTDPPLSTYLMQSVSWGTLSWLCNQLFQGRAAHRPFFLS